METVNQPTNELIKVEEITSIMEGAPDIITRNRTSVTKCKEAGQALLDTITGNGSIDSDELDAQVASYLEKTKTTVKNMNERRTPITQLLTKVSKIFTGFENDIDVAKGNNIPSQLQQFRNKYAAEKLAEKQRQEAETKRKLDIENEKIFYKTEYKKGLYSFFNTFLSKKIEALQYAFNYMTLDNFDNNKTTIINYVENFDVNALVTSFMENIRTSFLGPADKMSIRQAVANEVSQEFTGEYSSKIKAKKTELKDLFNSKYIELKELDEAAKRDKEEFARLQAEKVERERKEQERLKQKEADRLRKQQEELERQKQSEQMNNLFNASATISAPDTQRNDKVSKKLKISAPAGFVQVYQLWFEQEGMFLSVPELEKIHKKMITFCEKRANSKEEEFIKSPYVEYIDDVKAK